MAIIKAPGYAAREGPIAKPKPPPKPKPLQPFAPQTQVGYTGGSWRYPVSNTGTIADYRSPAVGAGPTTYTNPISGTISAEPPGGYGATTPDNSGAPLGGGGGGTGFNPRDWALSEYMNDPRFGDAKKLYDASMQASRGALSNALRAAVIRGGWGTTPDPQSGLGLDLAKDPTLAGFAGDIRPEDLQAAAANPTSARQQLLNQLTSAQSDIPWQLGARGAARSGAAGALSQSNLEGYKSGSFNAIDTLLQGLYGNVQNYGQSTAGAEQTFNQSVNDLINALATQAGQHTATSPTGYDLPAVAQPQYGQSPSAPTVAPQLPLTQTHSTPTPKTATNVNKVKAKLKSQSGRTLSAGLRIQ